MSYIRYILTDLLQADYYLMLDDGQKNLLSNHPLYTISLHIELFE
jgi:hypothetical protein